MNTSLSTRINTVSPSPVGCSVISTTQTRLTSLTLNWRRSKSSTLGAATTVVLPLFLRAIVEKIWFSRFVSRSLLTESRSTISLFLLSSAVLASLRAVITAFSLAATIPCNSARFLAISAFNCCAELLRLFSASATSLSAAVASAFTSFLRFTSASRLV